MLLQRSASHWDAGLFVIGGVPSTLSARVVWIPSSVVRVRAEAEVAIFPRLEIVISMRGPAPTGKGEPIVVRMQLKSLAKLDT
jgi:hypothetical protein